MIKMIRMTLTSLFITASAWTAYGYGVTPEKAKEASAHLSQAELAGHFHRCFERQLKLGMSQTDAGAICGAQVRNRIGESQTDRQASWQFLICLEEQSTANGVGLSQVVGLCRTLLSEAPGAPAPSQTENSQI